MGEPTPIWTPNIPIRRVKSMIAWEDVNILAVLDLKIGLLSPN